MPFNDSDEMIVRDAKLMQYLFLALPLMDRVVRCC